MIPQCCLHDCWFTAFILLNPLRQKWDQKYFLSNLPKLFSFTSNKVQDSGTYKRIGLMRVVHLDRDILLNFLLSTKKICLKIYCILLPNEMIGIHPNHIKAIMRYPDCARQTHFLHGSRSSKLSWFQQFSTGEESGGVWMI